MNGCLSIIRLFYTWEFFWGVYVRGMCGIFYMAQKELYLKYGVILNFILKIEVVIYGTPKDGVGGIASAFPTPYRRTGRLLCRQ